MSTTDHNLHSSSVTFVPSARGAARVLVIDDVTSIHNDIRKILRPTRTHHSLLGILKGRAPLEDPTPCFEIVSYSQGHDGVEGARIAVAEGRPFSVAFVDMRMPPGWDGMETITRLWEVDPDLQVVLCTAYSDYSWGQIQARLGASDRLVILKKPFEVIEVAQLAHVLAEKRSLLQRLRDHLARLEETVEARTRELVAAQACLLDDIARRKETELKLRKLSCAVEQSPASIVITDVNGSIEYVNPKFCAVTGYSAKEVAGLNPRVLKSGEMPAEHYRTMWETITGGREWHGEFRNRKKNGDVYSEQASISPIRDETGRIINFVAVKEDITERKRTAAELAEHKENEARSRRELEHEKELNQVKSRFVSLVSHEFRSPLCVIGMAASLLADYLDKMSAEQRDGNIRRIQQAVVRMTRMMEDLLVHEKLGLRKVENKPALLDVDAFCLGLIAGVSPASDIVDCHVAADAREAFVDERILVHIVGNVLNNAVKYSLEGGRVVLEVTRVDADARLPEALVFTVRDSGIGIPEKDFGNLFETFHRSSNVGNRPGTGMGMAIAKQFVDLLGGEIEVQSQEGVGTTVRIALPILPAASDATPSQILITP